MDTEAMENNITIRDIYLGIVYYLREFKKRWYWYALAIVCACATVFYFKSKSVVSYQATLSFISEGSDSGAGGMLSTILGNFGGGGSNSHNLDRMLAISNSQLIVNETALKKIYVDGKEDYIANHIIEYCGIRKNWIETNNSRFINFKFGSDRIDSFDIDEMTVLKQIAGRIRSTKDGLINVTMNEHESIFQLQALTPNPELTVGILDSMFGVISYYYFGKKKVKAAKTVAILTDKVDSLNSRLLSQQYQLASIKDRTSNLIRNIDNVHYQKLNWEVQGLGVMYMEAVKNQQISQMELENLNYDLLLLDKAFLPLNPVEFNLTRNLIMAMLISVLLMSLILGTGIFIRDALSEQ